MFAKIIIDIPIAQVNRTFDYAVPVEWQHIVQLGMRVEVPFGNRQLMGFIVELSTDTAFEGKLKQITRVLDYFSYLNEELIELSDYLALQLQAFRIGVMQAMLPNLLKVKYENVFLIHDINKISNLIANEELADVIDKQTLESQLKPSEIKALIDEGTIELQYQVIDKKHDKQVKVVDRAFDTQQYLELIDSVRKNAKQQRMLLELLINTQIDFPISTKQLIEQYDIKTATINQAIQNNWLKSSFQKIYRNPLANQQFEATSARKLRPIQQSAFDIILPALNQQQAKTFLLEGITGSGKTEVYLQLMEAAQKQNKSALLLVPEIALTPQMVERVVGRFNEGVAVLHSGLSIAEKYDEWQRIIKGEATIVVGARSSIFAPLNNLGIILIDEEHETTYKQSDNPRYHARDVAIWRSEYHHCPVVLGSATPSLESRARAQVGKYELVEMNERANFSELPEVELIDMTKVLATQTYTEISPKLQNAIEAAIENKHQVVLLLNRRGYASYIQCRECGHVFQCARCDISLTYHKTEHRMKCHYCDYSEEVPKKCNQCGSHHLRSQGSGTQKIEETLNELIPHARIIRMDNDTTRKKGAHEKLLKQFSNHQADILLGTQMIAKGLDFENVTLVGVINADTALNIPDFRASERTFQLLTQVAGRTGRGSLKGKVLIQTYNPEHYVMQLAKKHDYEQFFKYEMHRRRIGHYPPYYFTTLITVSSKNASWAEQEINQIKSALYSTELEKSGQLLILGPSKSPIIRINEIYYYQLLLKYKNKALIQDQISHLVSEKQKNAKQGLYLSVDHEPQHFI